MTTHLLDALLACFPPATHALTLVSDPDGLLGQAALAERLAAAGFSLIQADDPVLLAAAWYAAQPLTPAQPLIIHTAGPLNALPYDLWQQGARVDLSLARLLPSLDRSLLAGLSLAQLDRIYAAMQAPRPQGSPGPLGPPATLGRAESLGFVLRHAFGAAPAQVETPGPLLGWLAQLHASGERLPPGLADALLAHLRRCPALAGWPLAPLLEDPAAFKAFAQEQWAACVRQLAETPTPYAALVPFLSDSAVQSALPALVSSGVLAPVAVAQRAAFPAWAQPALHEDAAGAAFLRWDRAVDGVERLLAANPTTWPDWQAVAGAWAELTRLRYAAGGLPDPSGTGHYASLAERLAPLYASWLQANYAPLGNRRLPVPHHLHHIPHVLHQAVAGRAAGRVAGGGRVALIVLDGMSLAAWRTIWSAWAGRHPRWRAQETLVLAQVPTITAVSRQALLAGLPPRAFAASLLHNQQEEAHWRRFWQGRGLPADAIAYAAIAPRQARPLPSALDSLHTAALAVVLPDIDTLVHGASEGLAGVFAGLGVWLDHHQAGDGSRWVETLIEDLLARSYRVALTSDHGHVEAIGVGQPQEGVAVTTRSKRARIYDNARFAANVQSAGYASQTILWHDDGLLPDATWVLMGRHAAAFAPLGQRVVSHGGITLDETVVPFVTLTQEP